MKKAKACLSLNNSLTTTTTTPITQTEENAYRRYSGMYDPDLSFFLKIPKLLFHDKGTSHAKIQQHHLK